MSNSAVGTGRDRLPELLAVDDGARAKLEVAIDRAVRHRARSVILVREGENKHHMFTVRPATISGHAEVSWVGLDAGVSHLKVGDIMELLPLTPTEAAVALHLAQGSDVAEIAERRGVSVLTVRTQVKAIIRKAGVANQRCLVRLLTQIADALSHTPASLVSAR